MAENDHLDAILEAVIFAARKHDGQVRKDKQTSPYVTHPLNVARLIRSTGKITDRDILIAAILHDTIEDTKTKPKEIRAQFGEAILAMVLEVSDDKSLKKMCRKQRQVIHAPQLSYPAKIIKLGDKIANCHDVLHSPPTGWSRSRRQKYIQWAADVVALMRGANLALEAAFDSLLIEAETKLKFKIEPFSTVNNRPWGPDVSDKCA